MTSSSIPPSLAELPTPSPSRRDMTTRAPSPTRPTTAPSIAILGGGEPFSLLWQPPQGQTTVVLPLRNFDTRKLLVNWGDSSENITCSSASCMTHTYRVNSEYLIRIWGPITGFSYMAYALDKHSCSPLTSIISWGGFVADTPGAFANCPSLTSVPANQPSIGLSDGLEYMFANCSNLNFTADWDLTGARSLRGMFANATKLSNPFRLRGTQYVEDMSYMLDGTPNFILTVDWPTDYTTSCFKFCSSCGLPNFAKCTPCARKPVQSILKNQTRCSCLTGEMQASLWRCVPESDSPETARIVYANAQASVRVAGVGVTLYPDPAYGSEGTLVVDVRPGKLSQMASLSYVLGNSAVADINKLAHPIVIALPLNPSMSVFACGDEGPRPLLPICHSFDKATSEWREGCVKIKVDTEIVCQCTELTDVTAAYPSAMLLRDFGDIASVSTQPGGFIIVVVVGILLSVFLTYSCCRDRKQRRRIADDVIAEAQAPPPNTGCARLIAENHTLGALLCKETGTAFRLADRAMVVGMQVWTLMTIAAHFHTSESQYLETVELLLLLLVAVQIPVLVLIYLLTHTESSGWEGSQEPPEPTASLFVRISRYRFRERHRRTWYGLVIACALGMVAFLSLRTPLLERNPYYYCKGDALFQWVCDWALALLLTVCVVEPFKIWCISVLDPQPKPDPHLDDLDRVSLKANELPETPAYDIPGAIVPLQLNSSSSWTYRPPPLISEEPADERKIPILEVEIIKMLGQGAFGRVDQCIWNGADCAIKRVLNPDHEREFRHEIIIHSHLQQFKHQFVVNFIGITSSSPPGMLLELYPLKSVQDYITRGGHVNGPDDFVNILTVLVNASAGILHLHKNGVIHRDIAARNFLIKHDMSTAVCDFGLAVRVEQGEQGGVRTTEERNTDLLPVNTTAPETLARGEFSFQTDVFMFGMFVWEILARQSPHCDDPDLQSATRNITSFLERVRNGLRPMLPEDWPEVLKQLIADCWADDPARRPSMSEVNRALRSFRDTAQEASLPLPSASTSKLRHFEDERAYYETLSSLASASNSKSRDRGSEQAYYEVWHGGSGIASFGSPASIQLCTSSSSQAPSSSAPASSSSAPVSTSSDPSIQPSTSPSTSSSSHASTSSSSHASTSSSSRASTSTQPSTSSSFHTCTQPSTPPSARSQPHSSTSVTLETPPVAPYIPPVVFYSAVDSHAFTQPTSSSSHASIQPSTPNTPTQSSTSSHASTPPSTSSSFHTCTQPSSPSVRPRSHRSTFVILETPVIVPYVPPIVFYSGACLAESPNYSAD